MNSSEVKELFLSTFPIIFAGKFPSTLKGKSFTNKYIVNFNNFAGAYNITKYLINNGHKNILHIAGLLDHVSTIERLEGYKKALYDNGIEYTPKNLIVGEYNDVKVEHYLLII